VDAEGQQGHEQESGMTQESSTPGRHSTAIRSRRSNVETLPDCCQSQVIHGPDHEKWQAADKVQENSLSIPQKGRDGPVMAEIQRGQVPEGLVILPITKQSKIKSNGVYKSRYPVMENLDDFNGPTYASTASKKIVWLLFALTTRLGTAWQDKIASMLGSKLCAHMVTFLVGNVVYMAFRKP
jgi:hypothetical protein